MYDEVIAWRHELHANPELKYELHRLRHSWPTD